MRIESLELRSEADWRFKTLKARVRIERLGDDCGFTGLEYGFEQGVRGAEPPAEVGVLCALASVISQEGPHRRLVI